MESSDHYSFRLSSDGGTFSSASSGSSRKGSSKLKIDQMFHESRVLTGQVPKVHQIKLKLQSPSNAVPSSSVRGIPDRDTPFSEARSAVQRQIQKMFDSSASHQGSHSSSSRDLLLLGKDGGIIKHSSHGVSHAFPSEDASIHSSPPPPMHYGVSNALKSKRPQPAGSSDSERPSSQPLTISSSPSLLPSDKRLISPHPPSEPKKIEFLKQKVDYLGALPVSSKSTSLSSLQRPLKDLYFKYRAMRNLGQTNLPGTLEINANGLVVQYIRELHKGVQEIFNPFSTIAVWAAVRFLHRRELTRGSVRHSFAFLPLISDPEAKDKASLFNPIMETEVELASDAPHPPLFACVMRRNGAPKQLECHGFVCSESEDAIVIAANLYQALLKTMKKKQSKADEKPEKCSSSERTASHRPEPPARPPRRRKKERSSLRSNGSDRRSLKRLSKGRRSSKLSQRATVDRRSSRRKPPLITSASATGKGDVYTRVAIPRSKSFMNVSSQYNLQELFRELKEKEGVESIDDVLKKVLSPDGISFNEIKPVYRELLLKLAMTMTQDEIFQRSKNIISQKKSGKKAERRGAPKNEGILGSLFNKKGNKSSGEEASSSSHISSLSASSKVITKADISNPIPMPGKYSNSSTQTRPLKSAPLPPLPRNEDQDEVSSCCGGCGTDYETLDYSDCCSCPSTHNMRSHSIKPSNNLPSDSSSSASNESTILSCNCDYGSCDSRDKCYCTLTTPRSSSVPKNRVSIITRGEDSIGSGGSGYDSKYYSSSSSCCCSCYYSSGESLLSARTSSKKIIAQQAHKVLMCSAVDTKGNVLYQGSSNKAPRVQPRDKASVISMKKSAEIAAVFSGARINQTTDLFSGGEEEEELEEDPPYKEDESPDDAYDSMRPSQIQEQQRRSICHAHQFSEANLRHSLGYFP